MKRILPLLFLTTLLSHAQENERIEQLINLPRTQIERFDRIEASTLTYLPSSFAKEEMNLKQVDDLTITKVYYVYTRFKESPSFDQMLLDRKRFTLLFNDIEQVMDRVIEWEILEQTGCQSKENGPSFFHGFVLVHRPRMTEEERKSEISRLLEYFEHPEKDILDEQLDPLAEVLHPEEAKTEEKQAVDSKAKYGDGDFALYQYLQKELYPDGISAKHDDEWVGVRFQVDKFGRIGQITFDDEKIPAYIQDKVSEVLVNMTGWEPAQSGEAPVDSQVEMSIRVSHSRTVNGMYTRDGERPNFMGQIDASQLSAAESVEMKELVAYQASTIYQGLKKLDKNERLAVVMDVTGSMYPHIAALKRWLDSHSDSLRITSYAFFNDGDNKPTREKKIGETGGIYHTHNYEDIKTLISDAMLAGNGGEQPESDIEALLYAQARDTLCDAFLLIGDNYSEIRDLSLLKELNKKVNVLICAAPRAIRIDYLELVKQTGGYLIMNGVRYAFNDLKRGDVVMIEQLPYKYNGSTFKLVEE